MFLVWSVLYSGLVCVLGPRLRAQFVVLGFGFQCFCVWGSAGSELISLMVGLSVKA